MSTTVLSIDQLLRAAQLLEQNALMNKLGGGGIESSGLLGFSNGGGGFPAFGEGYKDRVLASKMRSNNLLEGLRSSFIYPSNSTGSSRRSSPLSVPSSSPNSPTSFSITSPQATNTPPMLISTSASGGAGGFTVVDIQAAVSGGGLGDQQQSSNGQSLHKLSTSSRQSRAAHNELEKNRRANLRGFLDTLKAVLPNDPECSRDTTLSLLTRARNHIRAVKERHVELAERRQALLKEHLRLRDMLQNGGNSGTPITLEDLPEHYHHLPSSSSGASVAQKSAISPALSLSPAASEKSDFSSGQQQLPLADEETLYTLGLLQALPLIYPYSSSGALTPAAVVAEVRP